MENAWKAMFCAVAMGSWLGMGTVDTTGTGALDSASGATGMGASNGAIGTMPDEPSVAATPPAAEPGNPPGVSVPDHTGAARSPSQIPDSDSAPNPNLPAPGPSGR